MTGRWHDPDAEDLIGTPADRAAVFDHLLAATLRRQAISSAKARLYDINPVRDMGRFRNHLTGARTPAEVWYALALLSNTRHDRHLKVEPVEGGLPVPADVTARSVRNYADAAACTAPRAPVRLATDFSGDTPLLFLADWGHGLKPAQGIAEGSVLTSVNGMSFDDYVQRIEPFHCHSTPAFFWYHLPSHIVRRGGELPDAMHEDRLSLGFATEQGEVSWTLDFTDPDTLTLPGHDLRYEGWPVALERPSFRLLRHPGRSILALDWHRFGITLVPDTVALMQFCAACDLLDHALIFDATRSRGGDYGGYLLQRLASRPFRINFGDLRLSDAIPGVIVDVLAEDEAALKAGDRTPAQIAAMGWRRDWLLGGVTRALSDGLETTVPVPFKCAHQPAMGDGILHPAALHFRGPIVCLTMPFAGSHIDQVVAQLRDNKLCYQIGMPLGGYSKTWVGTEVIRLPNGRPLARFGWSCGNTLRPNGEVLESNPAIPHVSLPPSRANHRNHHSLLVRAALDAVGRAQTPQP